MKNNDFAAFILTHGRPDRVYTYACLRRAGYTGRIVLLIDDLDKTAAEYKKTYGDEVHVFDKKAIAATFDQADNFNDMRAIIYARNASFELAKKLGIKYFIQLDDDYTAFSFRYDENLKYLPPAKKITNLDAVFDHMLDFFKAVPQMASLAMAQGGDFIGGGSSKKLQTLRLMRKCMNSFICSTERPFQFVGRINEDVNTYTRLASTGLLFFTTPQVALNQKQTQSNKGGMTELYLDSGTYIKSFYTVIYSPSCCKIKLMSGRLHHSISWNNAVPKIVSEKYRKPDHG